MKIPLLPFARLFGSTSLPSSNSITEFEDRPWTHIGEANDHLLAELEQLYWIGVEQALESIIITLKEWQSDKLNEVALPDESDNFVHGFDTFIDQVNKESYHFANQVRMTKNGHKGIAASSPEGEHTQALEQSADGSIAEHKSSQLKAAIRQAVEDQEPELPLRRRTRMLLQAIGLLDIEKLIEHRPPPDNLSFWNRPAVPQLQLQTYTKSGFPILTPLQCSSCGSIIRSSMYYKEEVNGHGKQTLSDRICEDCFRKNDIDKPEFMKMYKHSILDEVITPRISRKICLCDNVPHHDSQGRGLDLFPISRGAIHRRAKTPGTVECGLLKLGEAVAEAKYDGMQVITSKKKKDKRERNLANEKRDDKLNVNQTKKKHLQQPMLMAQKSKHALERDATSGTVEKPEADGDVPFFLERFAEEYPFGNVHMALRIGPIVIENGVANTKGGALITLRDNPTRPPKLASKTKCLALSDNPIRQLWWQQGQERTPKRFKAIMKQIVGSPFTGVLDKSLEIKIIDGLIATSMEAFGDPNLDHQDNTNWLKELLKPRIDELKVLIGNQLSIYLGSIISRLLSPKTNLGWSPINNNCQTFCDALIDTDIFGPLTAGPSMVNSQDKPGSKLYLLSFVCRSAGYIKPDIKSKFDVPRGLTEEYLLQFRYGRHDEADIIDTLQEYWHDWGTFGKTLYRYQDLFPWDCTEAFGRYPTTCGDCNLAKHVWAFPFDSWSIISLHLERDRNDYPAEGNSPMTDIAWMKNRLLVLSAQEKLILAATAMAETPSFRARTNWIHKQRDPANDKLKLGGIHRAQPFSHSYDQGKYHRYFIAPWAHLKLEDKVASYELLRDGRVKLPDVEYTQRLYHWESIGSILDGIKQSTGRGIPAISDSTEARVFDASFNTSVTDSMIDMSFDSGLGRIGDQPVLNCGTGCGSSTCSIGGVESGGSGGGGGGGGPGIGCGGGGACGGGG
ncbi:hypothetical protein V494_04310 [Pseudogymnoascus sp. VKM F-4513 (FW-928)]|nr:hypothetical protein V494_04310 [Pseudogymnoascus sp. VKM F-4513 (FW-928)]